LLTKAC
jgi:hypothetical protein